MKQQTTNLDDIFNLIQSGEKETGIKLLYSHHYNKIFGIAFLFVKNEADAEDIVNNATFKLLKLNLELFPKSNFSTWLYTFVKNESLMFLRKEKPTIPINEIITEGKEDQKIENYVNMNTYYSLIKNLSEQQRQIVTLKILGGYTHKEIALMLGKPIGTIQWIYNTSIKRLKHLLSAFITTITIITSVLVTKLTIYFCELYKYKTDQEGETMKGLPFDFSIIFFVVLFIISVIAFMIFFKISDKLPTKPNKKSI